MTIPFIDLEYGDNVHVHVSPRYRNMSVSYALGEFDHCELAGATLPEFKEITEESRWAYILCEARLASLKTVRTMFATNVVEPGPQVYWCDWPEGKDPIISVLTSIAVPDHITLDTLVDMLHKTRIPTSVINAEVERIQYIRWHVHNHGEPT